MTSRRFVGPLFVRLTFAFLAVAVAAVAVFGVLMIAASRSEVSGLSDQRRRDDLAATSAAAADAYVRAGGWPGADLYAVATVAARGQATLTVLDSAGTVIAAPTDELATMMARMHGLAAVDTQRADPVSAAVTVDGQNVGAVMLRFPVESTDAERHVRDAFWRAALSGIVIAVAVALIVALYVSARVTRPITALTGAAGELASGRRDTRVDLTNAPGELRTLGGAFNDMADHLDREDLLRRNLLADVAHELRTPLTILQGNTEAILDGVDQPTAETIGSLHDEVVRLRRSSPTWKPSRPPKPPVCVCTPALSTSARSRTAASTCSLRSLRSATSASNSPAGRQWRWPTPIGCTRSSSTCSPTRSSSLPPADGSS